MLLQELEQTLCRSDRPLSYRAVELFGFQVAIFTPDRPNLESMARVLAGFKILERLEENAQIAKTAGIEERFNLAGYKEILNQIMMEGGGRRLRSLWTTPELWNHVQECREQARDIGRMVHFSHRFASFDKGEGRRLGGVTMARYFVSETGGPSDSTLKNRWKEYGANAPLQYLLLVHHKTLLPKKLSSKEFVARLFEQADDREALRALFASYVSLKKTLAPRHYKFAEIDIESKPAELASFNLTEFSKKESEVLRTY